MARQAVEDINKLPKWAKEKIEEMERQIKVLEKYKTCVNNEMPTTNVYTHTDPLGNNVLYLPERSTIYFTFKNGRRIRVMLLERNGKEVVDINGDDSFYISPQASNAVHITQK